MVLLSDMEFESYMRNHMIQRNKRLMSKGDRKENAKYKQKWCVYITMRKYNARYNHVIHPILEYEISTQVIISTNLLSK